MRRPPETAERRPLGKDGVQEDGTGKRNVCRESIAEDLRRRRLASWRVPPQRDGHRDPLDSYRPPAGMDLADALAHLHDIGICACWVAGREHPESAS